MTDIAAGSTECVLEEQDRLRLTLRQKVLVVLGAAIGLAFGFGPIFLGVMGIVLKPMAASFDWSRADVAILPTLAYAGLALGAPLSGHIADRRGWNKVIAISIGLLFLGMMAIAVAPANHAYIIAVGILIGLVGTATTPAGYIAVISLVFDRHLGMAMGLAMIGIGIGAATLPIIAGMLVELMDWRWTFACIGGLGLVLGWVSHRLIFGVLGAGETAAGSGRTARAAKELLPVGEGLSLSEAVRGYRFWLIAVVAALVGGTTEGAFMHLVSHATDRGVSLSLAAQSAGLMGLGVGVARTGVGLLLDKVFAPLVAMCSFFLGGAGLYLLTTDIVQFPWLLPLSTLLVGLAMGAQGDLVPFLAKRYFGVRAIGSIFGALVGLFAVGAALGTYAYGWAFDLMKSYTPGYQAAAIVCGVCGLAVLLLGRYRFVPVEEGT